MRNGGAGGHLPSPLNNKNNSNHNNYNNIRGGGGGGGSRSNTPLHSPSSPDYTASDFNSYTDTDTDDNFSPDRDERFHRTKSPDSGVQSVSSRTVRGHKTTNAARSSSRIIKDESVQLDLPMADLMAYLQVVANNSSNLPLTRRDDPELGRTVSSLTSEEYALKCAAFIPANVRILGGVYGKYGSVWDLPTSEVSVIM